jgi:Domain of unknown function (DUF4271)
MLERLHFFTKYFFIIVTLILSSVWASTQNRVNPFDIRSIREINEGTTATSVDKDNSNEQDNQVVKNPFDIVPPKTAAPNATVVQIQKVVVPKVSTPTVSLLEKGQQFLFGIVLTVLIVLTSLVVVSRNLLRRIYNAIFNDVQLRQLLRERNPLSGSVYTGLYTMFLINMSVFIFLTLYNFNNIFNDSEFFTLIYCLLLVMTVFLGKQLLFWFLSFVFPISKELDLHAFIILIFSILIGLILAPTNVFLAYADIQTAQKVIMIIGFMLALLYVFVNVRALLLNQNIVFAHLFHFCLFFLIIEAVPIAILWKLASKNVTFNFL